MSSTAATSSINIEPAQPVFQPEEYIPQFPEALRNQQVSLIVQIARVIFCMLGVGLIYYGIKYLVGKITTTAVCAAAYISPSEEVLNSARNRLNASLYNFRTPDNETLNGALFKKKNTLKVVLFVGGNMQFYELSSLGYQSLADGYDASVFAFNRRGIGLSSGSPSHELIGLDTYSALRFLIDELGYNPSDITIHGLSMGSAAGVLAAQWLQEENPAAKINFTSDRSFSSFSLEANLVIARRSCHCLGWIAEALIRWVGAEFNINDSIHTLKGRKIVLYAPQDELIFPDASAYAALHENPNIKCIQLADTVRHSTSLDYTTVLNNALSVSNI